MVEGLAKSAAAGAGAGALGGDVAMDGSVSTSQGSDDVVPTITAGGGEDAEEGSEVEEVVEEEAAGDEEEVEVEGNEVEEVVEEEEADVHGDDDDGSRSGLAGRLDAALNLGGADDDDTPHES